MFAGKEKKGFWRTIRRTARELFMNNVRSIGEKGILASSSANCSRAVHEQCLPHWAKRDFGEQFSEMFASCSRTVVVKLDPANSQHCKFEVRSGLDIR